MTSQSAVRTIGGRFADTTGKNAANTTTAMQRTATVLRVRVFTGFYM
jgi:hypothetical protein